MPNYTIQIPMKYRYLFPGLSPYDVAAAQVTLHASNEDSAIVSIANQIDGLEPGDIEQFTITQTDSPIGQDLNQALTTRLPSGLNIQTNPGSDNPPYHLNIPNPVHFFEPLQKVILGEDYMTEGGMRAGWDPNEGYWSMKGAFGHIGLDDPKFADISGPLRKWAVNSEHSKFDASTDLFGLQQQGPSGQAGSGYAHEGANPVAKPNAHMTPDEQGVAHSFGELVPFADILAEWTPEEATYTLEGEEFKNPV